MTTRQGMGRNGIRWFRYQMPGGALAEQDEGSICDDTTHWRHTIPAMAELVEAYELMSPDDVAEKVAAMTEWNVAVYLEYPDADDRAEAVQEAYDELTEKLNEICPAGWWFGTQEGDGGCIGFWFDPEGLAPCGHCDGSGEMPGQFDVPVLCSRCNGMGVSLEADYDD